MCIISHLIATAHKRNPFLLILYKSESAKGTFPCVQLATVRCDGFIIVCIIQEQDE